MLRKVLFFYVIFFVFLNINVFASAEETYILKYKNDEKIYLISEEQKNTLLNSSIDLMGSDTKNDLEIDYIEPNYTLELFGEDINWNFDLIKTQYAYDIKCFGNDIKIGVIDSGVYIHEYLKDNICSGYNFIDNNTDTTDNIGHGTFVSGIICSDSSDLYSTGSAYRAKIIPLKCFDKNHSTDIATIERAIKTAVDEYKCKILNLSFGLASDSKTLKNAINYALQKGTIIIAAVGNKGSSKLYYPASYEGVVGVGSVNSQVMCSDFSQKNISVDVVAPGEGLKFKSIEDYSENSGTSFAAPHVTAAAAIALSVKDDISPSEFLGLIENSSYDLGTAGYDVYFGYGLLDIKRMIEDLLSECEYFISPIGMTDGCLDFCVLNNTQTTVNVSLICAVYDLNNCMVYTEEIPLVLPGSGKAEIENIEGGKKVKVFLWDNFQLQRPLCNSRNYNV